jgi:signal transduction histidine kinase
MRTDVEILDGLKENLGIAITRASDRGFLYMNSAALKMFQFSSFEEAKTCQRRSLFADCNAYQHFLNKQTAHETVVNERILFCRMDKSNFWGSITSRLYCVNGDVQYDEIIMDISDKVINEHKLCEKSHLLEKVANQLDRFIYSASHDLRSPISSMRGLISVFKANSKVFPLDQFLPMMEESLNKLETFVNRLVEFSKNSNEPVLVQAIDVGKMINSILDELKKHPNRDKVNIECSLDGCSGIYSDFNKLYTVLFQIIKNAFDYVDPAKPRAILSIRSEVLNEHVVIEIMDNGIGIDKRSLPIVFQMFYRGTYLSKGSGLGLFLAREAVTKLGGTIDIKSELNRGTLISLQIPNDARSPREQLQMA